MDVTSLMAIAMKISLSVPPTSVRYGEELNITCTAPLNRVYEIHFSRLTLDNKTKLLSFATLSDETDAKKFVVDSVVSNLVEKPTVSIVGNAVHFTITTWAFFKRNWFVCKAIPRPPGQPVEEIYKAPYSDKMTLLSWNQPSKINAGENYYIIALCPAARTKKIQIKYKKTDYEPWSHPENTIEFENQFWSTGLAFRPNENIQGSATDYNYEIRYEKDGYIQTTLFGMAKAGSRSVFSFGVFGDVNTTQILFSAQTRESDGNVTMIASRTGTQDPGNIKIKEFTLACFINKQSLMKNEEVIFAYTPGNVEIVKVSKAGYMGIRTWQSLSTDFDVVTPGGISKTNTALSFQITITGFNLKFSKKYVYCKTPRFKSNLVTLIRYDNPLKDVPFPARYSNDQSRVEFKMTPTSVETSETVSITCKRNDADYKVIIQRYNKYAKTYDGIYKCTNSQKFNDCPDEMTWKTNFSAPTVDEWRCYTNTIITPPLKRPRASFPVTLIVRQSKKTTEVTTQTPRITTSRPTTYRPTTAPRDTSTITITTQTPRITTRLRTTLRRFMFAPRHTRSGTRQTITPKATSRLILTPRSTRSRTRQTIIANATTESPKDSALIPKKSKCKPQQMTGRRDFINAQCCDCQSSQGTAPEKKTLFPVVAAFIVFLKALF